MAPFGEVGLGRIGMIASAGKEKALSLWKCNITLQSRQSVSSERFPRGLVTERPNLPLSSGGFQTYFRRLSLLQKFKSDSGQKAAWICPHWA